MVKKPFTIIPAKKLPTNASGAIASRCGRLMRWRGGKAGSAILVSPTGSIAAITKMAAKVKILLLESLRLSRAIPAVNAT